MWREARALLDLAALPFALFSRVEAQPRARALMVLPGFGADDVMMAPLRRYLARLGHRPEGWGLGRNRAGLNFPHRLQDLSDRWQIDTPVNYRGEAAVPCLCDRVGQRVRQRSTELAEPLTLIGWSLGGYIAREIARDFPQHVAQVITFGAPVRGGPKYTAAAPFFRKRGMDLDWIEREIDKREARPIEAPITALISRDDAIVPIEIARDLSSPRVEHIEISAAHISMGISPVIWRLIGWALQNPAR